VPARELNHAIWLGIGILLDSAALVWLVATVRRRRSRPRRAGVAVNPAWERTLDERERAVVVRLSGTKMIVEAAQEWGTPFNLEKAVSVSVVVQSHSGGRRRYLEFRGDRGRRVPLLAQNYDALLACLRAMPEFDGQQYDDALKKLYDGRVTVLQRPLPVNAMLIETPAAAEPSFQHGLAMIRGEKEEVISWDIRYDALAQLPGVEALPDEYGNAYYHLGDVRLGRLLLNDLRVRVPGHRTDVPVADWTSYVVLEQGGAANYPLLKRYFDIVLQARLDDVLSYERKDQSSLRWKVDGMVVQIVSWNDSVTSPASIYCWLSIQNLRTYPEFYADLYCESLQLEPAEVSLFQVADVTVAKDFRLSRWVRSTPPEVRSLLRQQANYAVWLDARAGKIGFANATDAVIVDRVEAVKLYLLNASPGKGGGWAELTLEERSGAKVRVAVADYRGLDGVWDEIGVKDGAAGGGSGRD
jgi:hypothetical protein